MPQAFLHDADALRTVLDAFPSPSLLVDAEARVLFLNRAAQGALGLSTPAAVQEALLQRGGHLLQCARSGAGGCSCGEAEACKRCVLGASVALAASGDTIVRSRAFLPVRTPEGTVEAHFLMSVAGVALRDRRVAIVTLENLSEIVKLTSLLPICFHCRRVRNEDDSWTTVEEYFKEKADIDFSHSLCADCMEELYPGEQPTAGEGTR